jgi:hypothetical protein
LVLLVLGSCVIFCHRHYQLTLREQFCTSTISAPDGSMPACQIGTVSSAASALSGVASRKLTDCGRHISYTVAPAATATTAATIGASIISLGLGKPAKAHVNAISALFAEVKSAFNKQALPSHHKAKMPLHCTPKENLGVSCQPLDVRADGER